MASTRDIRRRIKSIRNTAQITKAMQMVASSRMKRAQEMALQGRPYSEMINRILATGHGENLSLDTHPLMMRRTTTRKCVLLISTDKGLCGGLNTNLLKLVLDYPRETPFITVGKKGKQFLTRTGRKILADFPTSDPIRFQEAKGVAKYLIDAFTDGEMDSVDILYTNFVNTIRQEPIKLPLLPLGCKLQVSTGDLRDVHSGEQSSGKADTVEPLFEPDQATVLSELLPHAVTYQIWHCLLEARASEHSARMVAMKNATDNAKQIIKDLTLEYNKIRQSAITTEILEISTAAAAMQ